MQINITIRPLTLNDARTSVKWRNNPEIWKWTLNSPNRKILLKDELMWVKKVIAEKDSKRFAILANERYIGNIQLTNIKYSESYFGIFIGDTDYWGKGIGFTATKLIIQYGFEKLGLKKIKLRVRQGNTRAIHIYSKLGFKKVNENEELIFMELSSENFHSTK